MQTTGTKPKKQKVISILRDINISKNELFEFLDSLNILNATVNTSLEPEIIEKIYSHFKKEIEREDKRMKKAVDFTQKYDVEITEAQEKIRKEEQEKERQEEDARIKRSIEEKNRLKEEEKKKQELLAYLEREKAKKEEKEKEKQKKVKKKPEPDKSSQKTPQVEQESIKKPAVKKQPVQEKQKEESIPQKEKPSEPGIQKDKKPVEKPEGQVKKPDEIPKKKPKGKFERISIKDIKFDKRRPLRPDEKRRTGPGIFTPKPKPVSKFAGDDKKFKKDKKKFESEADKKKRLKPEKGHRLKDATQKEIDEAIRETFAKIGEDAGPSARSLARKRKRKERIEEEQKFLQEQEASKNVISVAEFITTADLASIMNVDPNEIIKKCLMLGVMVTINQRLDKDLLVLVAEEFGYRINFQEEYEEDLIEDTVDTPELLKDRAPVVTVMGHVDHGKTSLLDYVRKANVVAGEAGGITQHIGAYKVKLDNGKEISFLDTPGHEAFTAMRARGGQAADIVVLVVAADDSVMPQTVEAINHAKAANVPIVIAINKVDKPDSNPDRIKQQLADKDILVEEWGGKYQSVEISAKHGQNIDTLLEKILLEAELLELKANPDRNSRGVVLESKLDKGKGSIATILVQKGTLKVGDSFVAGIYSGKVKAMFDEREHKLDEASPSSPAVVLGFDGTPQAGDTFVVVESDRLAKEISLKRQQLKREQDFRQIKLVTLDDISKQISEGKQVELKIILKADTDGSAEALADSLHKLTSSETKVTVIHKGVGQISESDVLLAEASGAIIIGFNIRPNLNARKLAEKNNIDIRLYNIIYNVIDEVKTALEGMLAPDISEEITATVEVREVFKVPKIGNIAGSYVQDGKITRNTKVRLIRDGFVIFDGNISSLKRMKDDVREVEAGYECGIGLENFNDIKTGDIIEGYKLVETKRKLSTV
jgi:translation initiation factor IF-2